jgi:hypothetical protein
MGAVLFLRSEHQRLRRGPLACHGRNAEGCVAGVVLPRGVLQSPLNRSAKGAGFLRTGPFLNGLLWTPRAVGIRDEAAVDNVRSRFHRWSL